MNKYTVKGTNILHSTKLYPEDSQIELEKNDAEKLADYLVPVQNAQIEAENETDTTKTTNNTSKTTNKSKSKTPPKETEKPVDETKETEGGEE